MPAEVGMAAVWRRRFRRQRWAGADTRARPARVRVQNPAAWGRSRKVPVALSGVADQTGAERDDPGEAGGHTVAVGVAGDEMIGE